MKTKSKLLILFSTLLAFGSSAHAQAQRQGTAQYETVARFISQQQTFVQRAGATHQECYDNQVQVRGQQERGNTGAVLGGITGGLLGKQVGKGNGNIAATATGAVIGAITGDRMQNDSNQNTGYQTQRQCTTVQDPPMEVPSGYSITLSILDEGGEHRVVVQSQSPVRPDQNGMVHVRSGILIY